MTPLQGKLALAILATLETSTRATTEMVAALRTLICEAMNANPHPVDQVEARRAMKAKLSELGR